MTTPSPPNERKKRAIPAIVKSLGWVSFFTDSASEMIYPLLPALLKSFGAAPVWLGAMEGVAEATSSLVKWRVGPLVDRAPKKKPLILTGYGIATFARPLMALATAGWHVVALRTIDRFGKGIRGVPRDAVVAASVEPEMLATAFAFHRMMDNAGSVLGPILAFALMRGLDLPVRTVFALAIVPGLFALATLLLGVREPDARAHGSDPAKTKAKDETATPPPARLPPAVRRYLAVLVVFTLGSSADTFLLLRAQDLGLPAAYVPIVWLLLSGAKSASNMPGGWIADRLGRRLTLGIAWLLYAVFYGVAPFVTSPLPFAALVVAYGSYYGLAEGTERAMLAERAPAELRGRAFGAMHALTGLAVLPANLVFGVLYERDARLAFGAGAACAAAAAVLLFALVNDATSPPKPATLVA